MSQYVPYSSCWDSLWIESQCHSELTILLLVNFLTIPMAQRLPHDLCSDSFHLKSQRCSDFYFVLPRQAFCLQPDPPTQPNQTNNRTTKPTTQSQRHVANNKWSVLLFKHKITICCWHAGFGIVSRHLTSHKLYHSQHTTKTTRIQANFESTKSAVERAEATKYCAQ